eukprot:scaffold40873_cov63-Phaeocystis_antarctica.AAC.4
MIVCACGGEVEGGVRAGCWVGSRAWVSVRRWSAWRCEGSCGPRTVFPEPFFPTILPVLQAVKGYPTSPGVGRGEAARTVLVASGTRGSARSWARTSGCLGSEACLSTSCFTSGRDAAGFLAKNGRDLHQA